MSSDPYAIMLRPGTELNVPMASAMLAVIKSIARFEATRALRQCAGIVCQDLPADQAQVLAKGLSAKGMPASAVRVADMIPLPEGVVLREARFKGDGMHVQAAEAEAGTALEEVQWAAMRLLVGARLRSSEVIERTRTQIRMDTHGYGYGTHGGVTENRVRPIREQVERSTWTYVFDVLASDPWRRFRIAADRFNFRSTGLEKHSTSFANFAALVAAVAARAERARVDDSVRLILDGDPLTRLDARSLEYYRNYMLWRLQFLRSPEA